MCDLFNVCVPVRVLCFDPAPLECPAWLGPERLLSMHANTIGLLPVANAHMGRLKIKQNQASSETNLIRDMQLARKKEQAMNTELPKKKRQAHA